MKITTFFKALVINFSLIIVSFSIISSNSLAQINVINNNDSGPGSLRQAIINANAMPGPDVIVFQPTSFGTITMALGRMDITEHLTITGPGVSNLTIDANDTSGIFLVDNGNAANIEVSISGLRMINGLVSSFGENAGAIENLETLTITNCEFEGNTSDASGGAGAIFNAASGVITAITGSDFIDNDATFGWDAGAISNEGLITLISDCEFQGNFLASFGAGAIFNDALATITTIEDCVFNENQVVLSSIGGLAGSGGILTFGEIGTIRDCEFTNQNPNYPPPMSPPLGVSNIEGGAIGLGNNFFDPPGSIGLIIDSVFSGNNATRGAGVYGQGSTSVTVRRSTFNNNTAQAEPGNSFEEGGAIETAGLADIFNSTFDNNTSVDNGGALAVFSAGVMNLSFVTVANNQTTGAVAGGLFADFGASINVRNSILSLNTTSNCSGSGSINDVWGNYSTDISCGFSNDGAVIMLGMLADNGGPTPTMELIGGGPVNGATAQCDGLGSDGMPTGNPVPTDQRLSPRPSPPGGSCDAGAFEIESFATIISLEPPSATNQVVTSHTVIATITNNEEPQQGILVSFEVLSGPNEGQVSDPDSGECTPNDDCRTDENGEVSWTYTGSRFPGTDRIIATFFDEEFQMTLESNTVTKIWIPPVRNIPTLSEWGMIVTVLALGLAALVTIRKRRFI